MKDSRREFLKKAGKTILTGAGWTGVSLFGLTGCTGSSYWGCDYCTSGTSCYSCQSCTGCTGCTSSCTYNTGGTTKTKIKVNLSGWGFNSGLYYEVIATSKYEEIVKGTDDVSFGSWYSQSDFAGYITSLSHSNSEEISIQVKREIFTTPILTEKVIKTLIVSSSYGEVSFSWFPVGVYFSIKSNITNTPIGTVNIVIKNQSNNIITSGTTDTNGLIKFYVTDNITTYPLYTNTPYTAYITKSGFKDSTQDFNIQTGIGGQAVSQAFVDYMTPV